MHTGRPALIGLATFLDRGTFQIVRAQTAALQVSVLDFDGALAGFLDLQRGRTTNSVVVS